MKIFAKPIINPPKACSEICQTKSNAMYSIEIFLVKEIPKTVTIGNKTKPKIKPLTKPLETGFCILLDSISDSNNLYKAMEIMKYTKAAKTKNNVLEKVILVKSFKKTPCQT